MKRILNRNFLLGTLAPLLALSLLAAPLRADDQPSPTPTPSASPQATPSTASVLSPAQVKDLFDSLDLSPDSLKPVRDALAKDDTAAAVHELAQYYRNRTSIPWRIDAHHIDHTGKFDKAAAEDAVAGRVGGHEMMAPYAFPGGKIDWHFNLTFVDKKLIPNNGWLSMTLTRLTMWNALGAAYRATGDERYAKAWTSQLGSFLTQCPPPESDANPDKKGWQAILALDPNLRAGAQGFKGNEWFTIDSGIRMMGSAPDAFFTFLLSPSVSDQDILNYLYLALEHGRHLHTYNTAGNWFTMEMNGLFTTGALFPEFKDATEWRNYAVHRMVGIEKAQFLPDGAHEELSTGYGMTAIDNITGLYDTAKVTGRVSDLPADYLAPLEKAYEYAMYLTAPDRQIPQFNDSWSAHVGGYMQHAYGYFPNRKDFLWFASGEKEGNPPAETSHASNWAGYYAMRSGWGLQANYLVFRAGPLGASHSHQDKLNVVMWAFGREILFNSGGGTYDASVWRQYSVESFSKNTVVVDGLSQNRDWKNRALNISHSPIDARWESTPDHDFAAGVYSEGYGPGKHPATHNRRVLFIKPDLAIVSDTLTPNDKADHTYQARWHLFTHHSQKIDATGEAMSTDAGLCNLDVVPLNKDGLDVITATGQTTPELLGWRVLHNGDKMVATSVVQTRKGPGVQTFLTLLAPMYNSAASPIRSVTSTGPGNADIVFTNGKKLSVAASLDPTGTIEATETLPDGKPGRHVLAGAPLAKATTAAR